MVREIKEVLMQRDGITSEEADVVIAEAREQLEEYIANDDIFGAEDVCSDYFGLEPDYLEELLYGC